MAYCDLGADKRFGRIEFAISADVTPEFKKAVRETEDWRALCDKKGHVRGEWAEVCFVPNRSATKKGEPYRYIAIRERLKQPLLLGMDCLPFQTISFDETQCNCSAWSRIWTWKETSSSTGIMNDAESRRGPRRDERRPCRGKTPFGQVRGECGLVVDHGPCPQPQCGHEEPGPSRLMGRKKDEGRPLPPDQSSRTGHGACAGTDCPARRRSSVVRGLALRSPEDHGACLCAVGVDA